jgi:hypothetical protein
VALKLLHASDAIDEQRFEREVAVLAALSDPAVVRYIAHGTSGGLHWLATEWVQGEDLCDRLARKALTVQQSVDLVRRIAAALAQAHAMGVVHRDIKPSNLLLPDGDIDRVKIIDFGVVRRTREALRWTGTGILVGTPGYMAPEQARGASEIDARADVYALGCVLFECLTGRPVFIGDSAMAVLSRVLQQTAPRLTARRPELPGALDALVGRMLAREPADRPRDAGVVAKELLALGPMEGAPPPLCVTASPSISFAEQRVVTAVLVALETQEPDAAGRSRPEEQLRAVASAYGAALEPLSTGTFVALIDRRGVAADRAERAARAALSMRDALPEAPVAIASGRGTVLAGHLLGEVLDRGIRTLARAVDAAIPVDATTAALLSRRFDVEAVAGKRWLRGPRRRSSTEPSSSERRGVLPYLGRDRELAMLEAAYNAGRTEPIARAILVTGAPGVGKTRLADELCARIGATSAPTSGSEASEPRVRVVRARADALRASVPLGTLVGALLSDAAADGSDARAVSERLARELPSCHPDALSALHAIAAAPAGAGLAGVQVDGAAAALIAWIEAQITAGPLLLVLDDVQHADLSSVKVLDDVLERLRDAPLMVLALARPEVHARLPRLWTDRALQEIRLGPLGRKASQEIACAALGPAEDRSVLRGLVDLAEGNPLLLEELAAAHAAGARRPPETALALLEERFDGSSVDARRALRAASVLGERFWAGAVRALLGESATLAVDDWLAELCAAEVCLLTGRSDPTAGLEHAFTTSLLREAALATLIDDDRALAEELAAEWLAHHGHLAAQ